MKQPGKDVKAFVGRPIDQMPILLEQGYEPITVAEAMEWRLWALEQSEKIKSAWWGQPISCGASGLVSTQSYCGYPAFAANHYSQWLRDINSKTETINGGLSLGSEWPSDAGIVREITRNERKKKLHLDGALANPLWGDLVEGNIELLVRYFGELDSPSFTYDLPEPDSCYTTEHILKLNSPNCPSRVTGDTSLLYKHVLVGVKRDENDLSPDATYQARPLL